MSILGGVVCANYKAINFSNSTLQAFILFQFLMPEKSELLIDFFFIVPRRRPVKVLILEDSLGLSLEEHLTI